MDLSEKALFSLSYIALCNYLALKTFTVEILLNSMEYEAFFFFFSELVDPLGVQRYTQLFPDAGEK